MPTYKHWCAFTRSTQAPSMLTTATNTYAEFIGQCTHFQDNLLHVLPSIFQRARVRARLTVVLKPPTTFWEDICIQLIECPCLAVGMKASVLGLATRYSYRADMPVRAVNRTWHPWHSNPTF